MKAPAFQMYARDWLANVKLRRCSPAARGAWIDVMCLMHGSDEYGVLRWPLADIARAANVPIKLLRELTERDVLKGADADAADYVHVPRHAGKDGEPVTLLEAGTGPVWYCSRFLRDEWVRGRRGEGTRFSNGNQPPTRTPKGTPSRKPTRRVGEPVGDGPAVASASATAVNLREPDGSRGDPQPADPLKAELWRLARDMLGKAGIPEKEAGAFIGRLVKADGESRVLQAVRDCIRASPADPRAWLVARLQERTANKQEQLEARNRAAVEKALEDHNARH